MRRHKFNLKIKAFISVKGVGDESVYTQFLSETCQQISESPEYANQKKKWKIDCLIQQNVCVIFDELILFILLAPKKVKRL